MENQIARQNKKETDLIVSVREQLSWLTSRNLTNNENNGSKQVSQKAQSLRDNYQATTLLTSFNTDLQDVICGACRSVDQCEQIKSPSLCILNEAYPSAYAVDGTINEGAAISFMNAHLLVVSDFVGAKNKITPNQLRAVGEQILTMFPTITMVEFILFCARLRAGQYGIFYGSVDPQKILVAFKDFLKDRDHDYCVKEEGDRKAREEQENYEMREKAMSREDLQKALDEGRLPNIKKLFETKKCGLVGKISNVIKNITK